MSDDTQRDASTLYRDIEDKESASEELEIDISFRIIQQFSLQLYDNPRRAIEELVCNSYDANAQECHIWTPDSADDSLYILDDGNSMDMEGLEWLWKVAASRKQEEYGDDREESGRQQIGKFGVGKLAAFALGSRLTYVATKDGITRVVSVHQDSLKDDTDEDDNETKFDVYEIPVDEAEERIGKHLEHVPNPWDEGWDTWTLAIVSDIPEDRTGNNLRPWHLKNMIRSAIPTSTSFTAYLNEEKISDREPHGEVQYTVDVTEGSLINDIESSLKSYWASRKDIDRENVDEELYEIKTTLFADPQNTDDEIAGIDVPILGNVGGKGELYDRPLTTSKRKERGFQDNGFRVFVRGKLINKDDPLFGQDAFSFGVWAKFSGQFEMPGLDDVIRVQRDDVKDVPKVHIARRVLKKTFQDVRREHRKLNDQDDDNTQDSNSNEDGNASPPIVHRSFSDRLKDRSKSYAYDAVSGLSDENGADTSPPDLDSIDIETRPLNPTDKAVEYFSSENLIIINEEHPLFDTLRKQDNFTQNIEDAFREILAARLLIHGYLSKNGADKMALSASRYIFDSVLRSAAGSLGADELDYQLAELSDASTVGGTRFENAIVDIFQTIGMSAVQEGGPDTHDGVIEIPQAGDNLRISLEAKGSKGIVDHSQLNFDNVNRHRKEQDCSHAVVIAREFKLDGRGDKKSALLRNLDIGVSEEQINNISLMTTEAVEVFLRLHNKQPFTYSETIEIFKNEEVPSGVTDYIIDVWENKPTDKLTREIVKAAHEFMETDSTNRPSIGALTAMPELRGVKREKIVERIESLDVLTESVDLLAEGEIRIDASVDAIIDEVDAVDASVDEVIDTSEIRIDDD